MSFRATQSVTKPGAVHLHRNLKNFGIAAGLMFAPPVIINALALFGHGPWRTQGIEILGLAILLGVISLPLALLSAVVLRRSASARNAVAISAGIVFGGVFGNWAGGELRMHAFDLAAERAVPLVSAIHAYERRHGVPPEQLSVLVPEFIEALPDKLPPLKITVGSDARNRYHGNPWALTADVPRALLNWDLFVYLPNQNYADVGAASLDLLGAWAYAHE